MPATSRPALPQATGTDHWRLRRASERWCSTSVRVSRSKDYDSWSYLKISVAHCCHRGSHFASLRRARCNEEKYPDHPLPARPVHFRKAREPGVSARSIWQGTLTVQKHEIAICPRDGQEIGSGEIVRGHELDNDSSD